MWALAVQRRLNQPRVRRTAGFTGGVGNGSVVQGFGEISTPFDRWKMGTGEPAMVVRRKQMASPEPGISPLRPARAKVNRRCAVGVRRVATIRVVRKE